MSDAQADIDDLVGAVPPKGKRTKDAVLDDLISTRKMKTGSGPLVEDMMAGVTVSWLSQVFGMDPKTVKAKLADCPPLHRRKAGYVYHLPTACQFLVKPALSPEQYMKNMKPADLPSAFQDSFWSAALKRQKWEENAGDLWRSDRVRETLSDTFQTIKFQVQLWADTIDRQKGLSDEQRKLLLVLTDKLQEEIYKALVDQMAAKQTGPQLSELPGMLGETREVFDDVADLI
jgi:hypothetical protein